MRAKRLPSVPPSLKVYWLLRRLRMQQQQQQQQQSSRPSKPRASAPPPPAAATIMIGKGTVVGARVRTPLVVMTAGRVTEGETATFVNS